MPPWAVRRAGAPAPLRRAALALVLCLAAACTSSPDRPRPAATPPTGPATTPPERLSTLLSLFGPAEPAVRPVAPTGRAVVAVPAEAVVLDPFAVGGDTPDVRDAAALWLPGLWRLGPGGRRTPWLAQGPPTVSADGLRVTIDLRADGRWSDGRPITSADVVATWRRASRRPGPWRSSYAELAAVEAPTPSQVVLVQRRPGTGWARLFVAPTGVLPAHRLAVLGNRDYDLAVTGGPFRLAGRVPGLETRWGATPHPWPGSDPLLAELTLRVVPAFGTAAELFRERSLDVVAPYAVTRAGERLSDGDRTVVTHRDTAGQGVTVLTLNTRRGPLRDVRVRQAIAQALDRAAFPDAVLREHGAPAEDLTPPGSPGHRRAWARWRADVDAAGRLLDAAGWQPRPGRPRQKAGEDLTLSVAVPSPSEAADVVVRGLQVQLRPLGVQLDLAGAEAHLAAGLARRGETDLALTRWDAETVPDLGRLLGSAGSAPQGAGWSRWRDATADRLLAAAATAADLPATDRPVADVLARAADQVPVLPLFVVHPVTVARGVEVAAPVSGYGGPFAGVHRWRRAG